MKKPNNTLGILAFAFFALAIAYIIFGVLSMLKVTGGHDTYGQMYFFGVIFLIVGTVSSVSSRSREKKLAKLDTDGERVQGGVLQIRLLKHMHWGAKTPYVVFYQFDYNGKTYTAKSDFIWEDPKVYVNDCVTVLVEKGSPKISKLELI